MEVLQVKSSTLCRLCFTPILPRFLGRYKPWKSVLTAKITCSPTDNRALVVPTASPRNMLLSFSSPSLCFSREQSTNSLLTDMRLAKREVVSPVAIHTTRPEYHRTRLPAMAIIGRSKGIMDSLYSQCYVLFYINRASEVNKRLSKLCCSSISTVSTDEPGRSSKSADVYENSFIELRQAKQEELMSVAEIRRIAFSPEETFSVHLTEEKRQHDIYSAIVERLKRPGTCCLVVVKRAVPDKITVQEEEENDKSPSLPSIVIGTCDVSIHDAESGLRVRNSTHKRVVYVSSMAVLPQYRRKGVAKRLLNGVLDIAKLEGINEVFLHVDGTNTPAVNLYYSFGFQKYPQPIPIWLRTMARYDHVLLWKVLKEGEK
eukprot:jgi/Galph1/3032/GphlegSOOS_G1693.1